MSTSARPTERDPPAAETPGLSEPAPAASVNVSDADDMMSSLTDSIASANFHVGSTVDLHRPTDRPHPRFTYYKSHSQKDLQQEKRRTQFLRMQKKRRENYRDFARRLVEGQVEEEEVDDDDESAMQVVEGQDEGDGDGETEEEPDENENYRPRAMRYTYKNQLMQSEWLVEVPADFSTNWLMVPVPQGRRNFVIAGGGATYVYSRRGKYVTNFQSKLPGGRHRCPNAHGVTLLDTIYSPITLTHYVLDVMMWNDYSFYECGTDFRFWMARQKFAETPGLDERSRTQPVAFKQLPSVLCEREALTETLASSLPFPESLDGLLFYHRETHYLPGFTPLVGWLKGYMVPEMLGLNITKDLEAQRPKNYFSMKKFVEDYDKAAEEKEKKLEEKQELRWKRKLELKNNKVLSPAMEDETDKNGLKSEPSASESMMTQDADADKDNIMAQGDADVDVDDTT